MKIKVCGMRDRENIIRLAELKPDYMGLIFYAQSKRYANNPDRELLDTLPDTIKLTGVFVNADLSEIVQKVCEYSLDAVQLHGSESADFCAGLRTALEKSIPGKKVELLKAFGVSSDFNFELLIAYNDVCDFFLFDTKTTEHGGSGTTFDWGLLAKYQGSKPYFLSGGLGLENISGISKFAGKYLYGVDLNSRFETEPGLKNIESLKQAFKLLRN
ncbi:phosphoribosylanthranilate isomerase [Daejeonella sp. H1SJ63]|uniref:phosphoribosylanthranilate isomerase n=1 Tax=Daejeonella sp. H1SJ63 TaxID=3034145 RepID=UPI0023ECC986|nr:phosphoribosylanthranilate isomerase [Daejeonella sp. H1SJ63]